MGYEVGDILKFNTTNNDMMAMNGATCRIVEKDPDGMYRVEFIDFIVSVYPDELTEE